MAGRPRLPNDVARVTGAAAKNPQRFRGRADPKVPKLGPAPSKLTEAEAAAWEEFREDLPWLTRADRWLVQDASRLRVVLDGDEWKVGHMTEMRLLLSQMGATPVSRSKVSVPDEAEDDPADKFFN